MKKWNQKDIDELTEFWAAFGRHHAARVPKPYDPIAYEAEHGYHDEWPGHIPMAACLASALRAAPRYERLSARDFARAGQRIANIVAFDGSEHIGCDTGHLSKRESREKALQVAALGRALGLLSCVPGGVKWCGVWLTTKGGETDVKLLCQVS